MKDNSRKFYLDNIKALCIFTLFLLHSCEVFHCKEGFYIEGASNFSLTFVYCFFSPWIMATMFFISGISTMLSLEKRHLKQFYIDRCKRLAKPILFGILFIMPLQAYFIMKNHQIATSGIMASWIHFFTTFTDDMCGYNGEFTPAHLWYMCFLIAYIFILYPVIRFIKDKNDIYKNKHYTSWLSIVGISIVNFILCYGSTEETFLAFGMIFVLGMLLYNNDHFNYFIKQNLIVIVILAIITNIAASLALIHIRDLDTIWTFEYAICRFIWSCGRISGVLALMGLGQKVLDKRNRVWKYLTNNSYNYYYLHMPVLIIVAYYVVTFVPLASFYQFILILVFSIIASACVVEVFKRILPIKWGLELKNK